MDFQKMNMLAAADTMTNQRPAMSLTGLEELVSPELFRAILRTQQRRNERYQNWARDFTEAVSLIRPDASGKDFHMLISMDFETGMDVAAHTEVQRKDIIKAITHNKTCHRTSLNCRDQPSATYAP